MACSLIWALRKTADAHEQPVVAPVAVDRADVARERRGPQHGRRAAEDRAARGGERVLEALVRVELGPGLAPRHRLQHHVASREAVEPRDRLLRKLRVAVREFREGVAAADALHRVRRRRVRNSRHVADPGLVDRRVAPARPRRHDEHGPAVVALVLVHDDGGVGHGDDMGAAADALRQPPGERLVRRAVCEEPSREHTQTFRQALVERSGGEPRAGLDVAQRHNHDIRPRAGVLLRAHRNMGRLDDRAVPGRAGARGRDGLDD